MSLRDFILMLAEVDIGMMALTVLMALMVLMGLMPSMTPRLVWWAPTIELSPITPQYLLALFDSSRRFQRVGQLRPNPWWRFQTRVLHASIRRFFRVGLIRP